MSVEKAKKYLEEKGYLDRVIEPEAGKDLQITVFCHRR